MVRALRREDLLRWRLPSFQRRVARARAVVAAALAQIPRPYVAFSGGKDSLVVLDLVAREAPGVAVNWTDEELVYEENLTYVPQTVAQLGGRLTITTGIDCHGGWFWSWRDPPFWHAPLPGTISTGYRYTHLWLRDQGYGGAFLGLRQGERITRAIALRRKGLLYRVSDGLWHCCPLASWSADDVWAYIAGRGLPYNPVYDRLAEIGVPRGEQRVGPLPLTPGWHLRLGWPEMFSRLIQRYGARW